MNTRTKLLLLASLASAALACSACGSDSRKLQAAETAALVSAPAQLLAPDAAPDTEAPRRAFTPVIAHGAGLELADRSINEKSEKLKYKIDLTFPHLKGAGQRAAKFNRAVRALVGREVRDFKPARVDPEPERFFADKEHWNDVYDSLRGGYEIVHFADDLISLRFDLRAYGRGAAHSVQFYRVLSFDLKSGRAVEFRDLFKPGAPHLRAVAAYCAGELKRRDAEARKREAAAIADQLIDAGAAAEADNYRAWNLAAGGLLVSFAACQVDACAAGEKEVLVPYSALGAILNDGGPAARLFTRPSR